MPSVNPPTLNVSLAPVALESTPMPGQIDAPAETVTALLLMLPVPRRLPRLTVVAPL